MAEQQQQQQQRRRHPFFFSSSSEMMTTDNNNNDNDTNQNDESITTHNKINTQKGRRPSSSSMAKQLLVQKSVDFFFTKESVQFFACFPLRNSPRTIYRFEMNNHNSTTKRTSSSTSLSSSTEESDPNNNRYKYNRMTATTKSLRNFAMAASTKARHSLQITTTTTTPEVATMEEIETDNTNRKSKLKATTNSFHNLAMTASLKARKSVQGFRDTIDHNNATATATTTTTPTPTTIREETQQDSDNNNNNNNNNDNDDDNDDDDEKQKDTTHEKLESSTTSTTTSPIAAVAAAKTTEQEDQQYDGYVALTIDDAPCRLDDPNASKLGEVLDLLKKYNNSKATFMIISNFAKMQAHQPDMIRLLQEGHELGNHGINDEPMDKLYPTMEAFGQAIDEGNDTIQQLHALSFPNTNEDDVDNITETYMNNTTTTRKVKWFRAPQSRYTKVMEEVLVKREMYNVMCDCYAACPIVEDGPWIGTSLAKQIIQSGSGAIALLHMPEGQFRPYCLEALEVLLEELVHKQNWKICTISELQQFSLLDVNKNK